MPKPIPASTKTSMHQRLLARQRERWPELADVQVRFRGRFAYVDGELAGGELLPLCRLRYLDSASMWGFAIYLASRDGYQDSVLPSGRPVGAPQEALDCACGLYLNDPVPGSKTGRQQVHDPARTYKADHLVTPGLACACGLYLGDPSSGSTIEVVAEELGRASVGDGEHDQDDEEPAPVGSSTSTAGERVVAVIAEHHASLPLRRVRAGELRVRTFSTNSRPASGRPPAALGRHASGWTVRRYGHQTSS